MDNAYIAYANERRLRLEFVALLNCPLLPPSSLWFPLPWQVIDHYENPRNVGSMDKNDESVGTGLVGAPACGDVMKLQVRGRRGGRKTAY